MKIEDIIKQLRLRLPFYTDLFTETLLVDSLSYDDSNTNLTITTDAAHGLTTNDLVSICEAIEPLPILQLNYNNQKCSAVANCEFVHDIVLNTQAYRFQPGRNIYQPCIYEDDTLITISGADQPQYNGQHVVTKIIDSKTFEYLIIGDQPNLTPATGTITLDKEINAFNGIFQVQSVGSASDFTIQVIQPDQDFPLPPVAPKTSSLKVKVGHRISGAATIARANQSYTVQGNNKLWLFCVREDTSGESSIASQQRNDPTDAIGTVTDGSIFRQNIIQKMSLIVFAPATDGISARVERDLMEDVRTLLFKSILGIKLNAQVSSKPQMGMMYIGDGPVAYNTAYYIHRFTFENIVTLVGEDIAPVLNPSMIDCIDLTYLDAQKLKDEVLMTDEINYENS